MCKSDLILGDIVMTRNNGYYIYCKTDRGNRLLANDGWLDLTHYHNDFTDSYSFLNGRYDIVKVFRFPIKFRITKSFQHNRLAPGINFISVLSHSKLIFESDDFLFIDLKRYVN